ncbi:flavin reductase family protein [Streptomyces flaveolus]|uniref:flavin reductase family protein n=1 Tax=Streptomyces flaveolus TaxID=67297 RepID=UPI0033BD55E1
MPEHRHAVPPVPGELDTPVFREAMSRLAVGVTIVAARDDAGHCWGFTATSVTSASLEPPLLLVGIARTLSCYPAFRTIRAFTVNILKEGHQHIARRFATSGIDRFAEGGFTQWRGGGPPCLDDAHVSLHCKALDTIPVGDHELLVGKVIDARFPSSEGAPLVWYGRAFGSVTGGRED